MDPRELANPHVRALARYQGGKPIEEVVHDDRFGAPFRPVSEADVP